MSLFCSSGGGVTGSSNGYPVWSANEKKNQFNSLNTNQHRNQKTVSILNKSAMSSFDYFFQSN